MGMAARGNVPLVAQPLQVEHPASASGSDGYRPEAIYREHYAFVWRNARRLGARDDWVEDAAHEVFLVATRRLAEFEARSSVRTWLFSITARVVRRMLRDRARHLRRVETLREEPGPSPNEPEAQWQSRRYLRDLLGRLDDSKRTVVVLAELEGMTSAEIAGELRVPVGTVDSRLRAARKQLLRMVARDEARARRRTR